MEPGIPEIDELHHDDQLRSWAKGNYASEAATTELLVRAGWAQRPPRPWVITTGGADGDSWIDFAAIAHHIGGLSGGQQRFLLLAASRGGGERVRLGAAISGLDRAHLDLVLAAIAHAAGTHEGGAPSYDARGLVTGFTVPGSLHPWPGDS